jgi:hypothetical protein
VNVSARELVWEIERAMMELEGAYNATSHLYVVLAHIIEERDTVDKELREKLRQLSLLCFLFAKRLLEIEAMADKAKKKRWGW